MNLALLIGHFPPGAFGGAELQAEAWAMRLARRHRVTVVTRRDPESQPEHERRDGFDVVRLPVARTPILRTWLDRRAIARAVAALDPQPDLLLCFQTFISGLAGVDIQKKTGIPAIVWVRGELEYRLNHSLRARLFSPGVWSAAKAVLVQTESARIGLLAEVGRRRAAVIKPKLYVIANGIEMPPPPVRRGARILSVGRLIPEKGMDLVIDAAAGVQGLLTIVGDGPERARLEARARHHDSDVRFEGHVSRERLAELYDQAACVVLAARRGEGLPNVVLEAMAHGRAVVVSDVPGSRDLVRDGVNGLVVPPDDPRALRDALARLAHERGLADRLGDRARFAVGATRWESIVPQLEAFMDLWVGAGRADAGRAT